MFSSSTDSIHYEVEVDYANSSSGEYFYLEVSNIDIQAFTSSSVEQEPPIDLIREEDDLKIAKRKRINISTFAHKT